METKDTDLTMIAQSTTDDPIKIAFGVINKYKVYIAALAIIAGITGVILAKFVLKKTYMSQATIIVTDNSGSGVLGQFEGFGSITSSAISSLLGDASKNKAIICAFLGSDTIQERLIDKYQLLPKLYESKWNEEKNKWDVWDKSDIPTAVLAIQEEKLEKIFKIEVERKNPLSRDKSDAINLKWISYSPEESAAMLWNVIHEIQNYVDNDYISDATRLRQFTEAQVNSTLDELNKWSRMTPRDNLSLADITRERTALNNVYTDLRRQLETAKLCEKKENISFKVLDPPYMPVKKYGPKGLVYGVVFFGGGVLFSVLVFFAYELIYMPRRKKRRNNRPA